MPEEQKWDVELRTVVAQRKKTTSKRRTQQHRILADALRVTFPRPVVHERLNVRYQMTSTGIIGWPYSRAKKLASFVLFVDRKVSPTENLTQHPPLIVIVFPLVLFEQIPNEIKN